MELKIKGETFEEEVSQCEYTDYSTARCDTLQLNIKDKGKEIRNIGLKKGDTVEVEEGSTKSGIMYISEIGYSNEDVFIKAISTKLSCFREKSFYRDTISFREMVEEIKRETGYGLRLKDEKDTIYIDVTRIQKNPIAYLTGMLRLEGYQVKINNNTLIIYDEKRQEEKKTIGEYKEEDFARGLSYSTKDANLIESIENTYKNENYTIKTRVTSGIEGKNISTSIAVSSIEESERFSRGLIREANKYEYLTAGCLEGLGMQAGQSINIDCNLKDFEGKNYIYIVKNDLLNGKQMIYMRKPIRGEY